MPRTGSSRTSRITQTTPTGIGGVAFDYGTSSDADGSNFEEPQDISDIAAIESDIGGSRGTPPRRPPMGGIDLGKGLDLEKPKPPRSGIGIEIGKSPQGNLGVGVEVPIGLSPFGARGGIAIDPATGQIRGGYGGLGVGKGPIAASVDIGVDTPIGSEEAGCFKYVTVSLGPFSHTYGVNQCETKPPTSPTPTTVPEETTLQPPEGDPPPICKGWGYAEIWNYPVTSGRLTYNDGNGHYSFVPGPGTNMTPFISGNSYVNFDGTEIVSPNPTPPTMVIASMFVSGKNEPYYIRKGSGGYRVIRPGTSVVWSELHWTAADFFRQWNTATNNWDEWLCLVKRKQILRLNCTPLIALTPSYSPPLPNPPPKKMDDNCCKLVLALQLETLRLLGREVGPNGLIQQTKKVGFLGEEIERVETPISDPTNPKKIKIQFLTVYDLLKYVLKQANNLDTALDPQSYKPPTGFLQNPKYNRDSEESLKTNKQPSKDKAGNKRELEINKDEDAKINGFLQQQTYAFQMLRRLEYLFPFGELEDALIAKSLLVPGAKGEIKIHNMIQAYELQMQYLDAALGNPRELLTIKDANPAIEGDQPIEIQSLSISDLLRQNIKFHIDTGGDVDALVNLVLRDFRTNLANRIDLIKNTEMVQALFEDSGMIEKQEYIQIHLEGDVYAGQWIKGQGFQANPDLEKKTEEATEKVLRETMKPSDIKVKVSRRSKDEKTDIRDLIRGLADFMQRLLSIPSAGDAAKSIDKLIESAKFKVQTDMALIRQNVSKAAAASRNRTKKRKK